MFGTGQVIKFVKILKWVWVALCVAVLVVTVCHYDSSRQNDIGIFTIWSMLILTFPMGHVSSTLIALFLEIKFWITGQWSEDSLLLLITAWLIMFAAGYWQWVYLIPWLVKRYKKNKQ